MKIFIRTDASLLIGSGHVMRCLTLAEELSQAGVEVGFMSRNHEGNLNGLIRKKSFKLYELPTGIQGQSNDSKRGEYVAWLGTSQEDDASETIEILKDNRPDWLIVDHYALDEVWERLARPYAKKIMVIDDLADRLHDCDLLLDQNYTSGNGDRYSDLVPPSCTKLLGPRYALLRSEFAEARRNLRRRYGTVRRLFVFFGGFDPDNMTGKALQALRMPEFSQLDVDVVLGVANPHRKGIEHLVDNRPRTSLHVQVDNMAELMSKADLALCAGGSSTWERFCVGLPSLVVTIADNQVPFTRDLHQDGLLRWLGTSQGVDAHALPKGLIQAVQDTEWNRQEAEMGMRLVDGSGALHVSEMILRGPVPESLFVRKTVEGDCRLFWYWTNDSEVRKNAFNPVAIPWDEHKKWFFEKLEDPYTTLYVIHSKEGPVGQVRFDRKGEEYVISYSLARQFRGLSLGGKILQLAINRLKKTFCGTLRAEVKADNTPSNRIFRKLGFIETESLQNGKRVFQKQI